MQADEPRTPAQLIESHLHSRGWTQRVLALVLGMSDQTLSRIMGGSKAIDAELALSLHSALGVEPEHLLRLQREYELAKARIELRPDPGVLTRAAMFQSLPIMDMIKRGWLLGITDVRDRGLETALCSFFRVDTVDQIEMLPHAAKKTEGRRDASAAQLTWLHRVRQIAAEMLVGEFSQSSALEAITQLGTLLGSLEATRKVPRILSDAGIRFVIVESLPNAKIDGVCCWLGSASPVIGLSLRFDRIDNFWFVLRHELEHVIRGDGQLHAVLDTELEGERADTGVSIPSEERVANQAAADFCVDQSAIGRFIAKKNPYFAEKDILGFAKTLGVHPGLVAGQLQRKLGRYDRFRNHLAKVRAAVIPGATVDGWGEVAPVEF